MKKKELLFKILLHIFLFFFYPKYNFSLFTINDKQNAANENERSISVITSRFK